MFSLALCKVQPADGTMSQHCFSLHHCSTLIPELFHYSQTVIDSHCDSGGVIITHHIACTDTGLKTWVRLAVFTVKPLRSRRNRRVSPWGGERCSFVLIELIWSVKELRQRWEKNWTKQSCSCVPCPYRGSQKVKGAHPSPSRWIFVSLHRGSTMPTEQLLLAGQKKTRQKDRTKMNERFW